MRIAEPYAKMVSTYSDGRAIITQIATAARTSHKSESSGYEADLELVLKLIGWGHLSCLEHAALSADIRWICCQLLEQFREYVPVVLDDLEADA